VLVKGPAPATGRGYPQVLESELRASGHHAVVRDLTAPSERVTTGIRNWERQVFPWSPDVVVLGYGAAEAEPVRGLRAVLDRRVQRFADDLERLVRRCLYISNPLVLLPELPLPGERAGSVNEALAEVVRRVDLDHVRVFPTREVLATLAAAGRDVVPGTRELTAEAHEAVGRAMADQVRTWCEQHVPV